MICKKCGRDLKNMKRYQYNQCWKKIEECRCLYCGSINRIVVGSSKPSREMIENYNRTATLKMKRINMW